MTVPIGIAQEIGIFLGLPVHFGCSAKEYGLGDLGGGRAWTIPSDALPFPGASLMSASASGTGWTCEIEVRGNEASFAALWAERMVIVGYKEWQDTGSGLSGSGGGWATLFVLIIRAVGGVEWSKETGETSVILQAATPDAIMQERGLRLPKIPYVHRIPVEKEREAYTKLVRKEVLNKASTTNADPTKDKDGNPLPLDGEGNPIPVDPPYPEGTIYQNDQASIDAGDIALGFPPFDPEDTSRITVDPFAGFANFDIDPYSATPSQLITARPANELHIKDPLSLSYALKELFTNHVLAQAGGGSLIPISYYFGVHIDAGADGESKMLSCEFGPGSPHDAALEAASNNGPYIYYWNHLSQMYFVLDPAAGGSIATAINITDNYPGVGKLSFSPGSMVNRIDRVVVQGQWSAGAAGAEMPAQDWSTTSTMAAAIYPYGAPPGSNDYIMTGYQGTRAANMAQALHRIKGRQATFRFDSFPYLLQAVGAFKQIVEYNVSDPSGIAGISNKKFICDSVSISRQEGDERGGYYWLATLGGTEI